MKKVVKKTNSSEIIVRDVQDLRGYGYGIWILDRNSLQKINQLYYNSSYDFCFGSNDIGGSVYSITCKSLQGILSSYLDKEYQIFIPETKDELLELLKNNLK